ncbi:hypothetical protein OYC64_008307 [Pagothenia borchgrevinki]|uniref:SH2 domain-containing protein n=1 Tax=Pagothenia borchgrevinki TaxID=8213 RepID=A0ABD2G454_PAGBO
MMEASVVSTDTGLTSPLTGPLDSPPTPSPASIPPASPLSPPSLPSSNLPLRPCRPKPPPPLKSSCPPAATPPALPPPLPPVSKPPPPLHPISKPPPTLSSNPPPPSLPPPLSPTPASPPPILSPQPSDPTPCPPPLLDPLSPTIPSSSSPPTPPVVPPSGSTPPLLSPLDRLLGSVSVWQPKGLSQDRTTSILEKDTSGAFLVHSTEDKAMTLSVRLPDELGGASVHNLRVKQHKTFLHLDGSSLVFDDIFKLISFYCASRDILAVPLRLPRAITTATKREELEVISAMGADFWTSTLSLQAENQEQVLDQNQSRPHMYVNPVPMEDSPSKDLNTSSISKLDIITTYPHPLPAEWRSPSEDEHRGQRAVQKGAQSGH